MTRNWVATLSRVLLYCPLWMQIPLWLSCCVWWYALWIVYKLPAWANFVELFYMTLGITVYFVICYAVASFRVGKPDLTEHDEICAKIAEFSRRYAAAKGNRGEEARVKYESGQFRLTIVEDGNGHFSYRKE